MVSKTKLNAHAAVLVGVAIAAAAGIAVMRSDRLLTRGFDKALESPGSNLSFERAPTPGQPAGDEGYWLTRSQVENSTPFGKSLATGDRITIAGQDGRERHLEVVDVKAIGGDLGRSVVAPLRLTLVTCRVTGEAAGEKDKLVRFIIEAEHGEAARPAPAKAL